MYTGNYYIYTVHKDKLVQFNSCFFQGFIFNLENALKSLKGFVK